MTHITIGTHITARDKFGTIRSGEVIAVEENLLKVWLDTPRYDAWGCGWDYVHTSTVTEATNE